MNARRTQDFLIDTLRELRKLPCETEWVEFKRNNSEPQEIGEYISALSNSAALYEKETAFLVWGIDDKNHAIVGTQFSPQQKKVGNEDLENWLIQSLSPKINFLFHQLTVDGLDVVMLEMDAARNNPVQFRNVEYVRVGSHKKRLNQFPEKARALWRILDRSEFEKEMALENVDESEIFEFIDCSTYFELLEKQYPQSNAAILEALESEQMISRCVSGKWNITNLGALLFANQFDVFPRLKRKPVRVIFYDGESRVRTLMETIGTKGYAVGFVGLINHISKRLPRNEVIGKALRKTVPMFPDLAVRELIANAIIHQDFRMSGTSPMIEVFSNRMEITNPGVPLVDPKRFLDSPPLSRNEMLASFMRRIGVCEERGSGIDKVVSETELYQLPAPLFEVTDQHTRSTLFAHKNFSEMNKDDRIWACYFHASLRYVNRGVMTNSTLGAVNK